MKFIQLVCIPLLLLVVFAACKKSKTVVKTKADLLTQKSWKLAAVRNKPENGVWEEVYPFMDSCRRDNILNFNNSAFYSIDEGLSKCFPADSQILVWGSWAFANNETQIVLMGNQFKSLLILNEDTLKYSEIGPSGWGTYTAELTYVH